MRKANNRSALWLAFIWTICLPATYSFAQSKSSYRSTSDQLQKTLAERPLSGSEYYNLGTAYAKLDSLGPARLYLERARLLQPWDRNVRKNIKWVRTELAASVAILPQLFLADWWHSTALMISPLIWQILGLFCLLMILLLTFLRLYRKEKKMRGRDWISLILLMLLGTIFLGLSVSAGGQMYGAKRWVVIYADEGLKAAPEMAAAKVSELFEGLLVEPIEEVGDWWQVKSEDGTLGWMKKKYLEKVSFDPTK